MKAPFLRHEDQKSILGSKYYGVVQADPTKNDFAVEFPMFVVDDDRFSKTAFDLPPCCTSRGNKVILMAGIESEYLAGQIYVYVIRVLYGSQGVTAAREKDHIPVPVDDAAIT